MGIIQKFLGFIYDNTPIMQSGVMRVSTRYGIFHTKAYQHGEQEHLAIMSRNFFDLENPIVYIHSDFHACDPANPHSCYCNNQMDMALKMIYKEGGLVVFHGQEGRHIDGLLQEMSARKLQEEDDVMTAADTKRQLNLYGKEYQALAFILKSLNLSKMKLITNDPRSFDVIQNVGIEITKQVPMITFGYGVTRET